MKDVATAASAVCLAGSLRKCYGIDKELGQIPDGRGEEGAGGVE